MAEKQEVYRSIKLDDNTNRAALGLVDQIKLILSSISHNDDSELDVAEKLSVNKLKQVASLNSLLNKAIERMKELGKTSVTLNVSSKYLPYIDDAVSVEKGLGRYYDIQVFKRNLSMSVQHYFVVRITMKEGGNE